MNVPEGTPAAAPPNLGALAPGKNELASRLFGPAPALNVWTLLACLRRRWLPAAVLGVFAAAGVVFVIWNLLPAPKHLVRSLLHVSAFRWQPIETKDGYSFEMFQRSQVALAKSRFVIAKALADPKVKKLSVVEEQADPAQWLEGELQVDFSVSPETMRISLRGRNTEELRLLVDAVTDAYLKEIANSEHKKYHDRLEELKKAYRHFDLRITQKRTDLRNALQKAQGATEKIIGMKHELVLKELGSAQAEYASVKAQLRTAELELAIAMAPAHTFDEMVARLCYPPTHGVSLVAAKLLKAATQPDETRSAAARQRIDEITAQDAKYRDLVDEEKKLRDRIGAEERLGGDPKGVLASLYEELGSLNKQKAARRAELLPRILEKLRGEMGQRALSDVSGAQMKVHFLQRLEWTLQADIDQLTKRAASSTQDHLDVDDIKYDILLVEGHWREVTRQIAAMEANSIPERVQPLEPAIVYGPETKTTRYAMLGMGGIGAFALVAFLFAWLEFRSQRISAPDQLTHQVGMQLVGTLPHHRYLARSRKSAGGRYDTILSDSVDAVRTTLLFMSRMEGVRSVLVTSAVAGEGKTSSATHLAASLARAGRKTLLVDCDIRNPVAHRVFKVAQAPGISELLRGEVEIGTVIVPTEIDGLSMLPAGNGDAVALQVLALDTTSALFQELKARFDFVVVDSSPVLPVPDALLVAQQVDAVVFSVLRDVSTLPKIQSAYRRLGGIGVRILGAIFNGSREEAYAGYSHSFSTSPVAE